jgi:hypothetical protein
VEPIVLPLPEEPRALRASTRTVVEDHPEVGMRLIEAGEWIAGPLWDAWRDGLEARGLDRAGFLAIVVGYRNELRLWVMGERPWDHCAEGLAGRIIRRLPQGDDRSLASLAKPTRGVEGGRSQT